MNLPLFGAEASGLFAEHDLDVELVKPVRRTDAAAASPEGRPEFAVTAVQPRLRALARRPGVDEALSPADAPAPERFVAVVHQRSPLAAFVGVHSPLRWPSDLAGARVAASTSPSFDLEYDAGLALLGLEPAVRIPVHEDGTRPSMIDGEVEIIGSWDESIAVLRRRAGMPVRSIPFGPRVYTTGLVAGDGVPADLVSRMVAALRAAFEQQRDEPTLGLEELCRRVPSVDPGSALEEWGVLDGYVFADGQPLAMTLARWQATIDHAVRTYGITQVAVAEVCREELAAPQPTPTG